MKNQQVALAAATATNENGVTAGYAWIPLENGNGDPATGPGVERVSVKWVDAAPTTRATMMNQPIGTPHPVFSAAGDSLEYPYRTKGIGVSSGGTYLGKHADATNSYLKFGNVTIATDNGQQADFQKAVLTSQGDVFFKDPQSSEIRLRLPGGQTETLADQSVKPGSILLACRIPHSANIDIAAHGDGLWARQENAWNKVKPHPLNPVTAAKGISEDLTILLDDGKSVMKNGRVYQLAELTTAGDWTDFRMEKMNDHGMMVGRAKKDEKDKIVLLLPIDIVPDYNRDGKIDKKDRNKVTTANPWRWWINDDNDQTVAERGGNTHDIRKQSSASRDCNDLAVDGMRDLIDFFPVHLDLEQALEIFPASGYKYIIKHKQEALKFYEYPTCVIDGSVQGSESNRHVKMVAIGRGLAVKDLQPASSTGSELSSIFLTQAKLGQGVIVVEGAKKTDKPLILEIKKHNGTSVVELEFPIKIVDVEDMYRHVNLRAAGGVPTQKNQPSGYPDDLTNGRYAAYIHGFNVGGESARGSQSNLFKRLHQLGNKARFIGVFWDGNPDNPLGLQSPAPDYHAAVFNGLLGGLPLKNQLAFAEGAGLTVLAHSLGNSIAGSAIALHGLVVSHYYIINGAIPLQAYDAEQTVNSSGHNDMRRSMTEDDWKPYYDLGAGERLLAANWHGLFAADPADNRNKLTWKNLFATPGLLSVAYNFYSPGDEVVENANEDNEEFLSNIANAIWTWDFTRHAWVQQEIAKGGQSAVAHTAFDSLNGGWEFYFGSETINNITYPYGYYKDLPLGIGIRRYTPVEADAEITNAELKIKPFYKPFVYSDLYDPALGSATAGVTSNRYKLLATGIPATSYAIAVNEVPKLKVVNGNEKRNYNMLAELKSPGGESSWPVKYQDRPNDWLHSDFKDVALHFLHPMYQKMIDLAELDKN